MADFNEEPLSAAVAAREGGRWHQYAKNGNRWTHAGPSAADPETAAEALQRQ